MKKRHKPTNVKERTKKQRDLYKLCDEFLLRNHASLSADFWLTEEGNKWYVIEIGN